MALYVASWTEGAGKTSLCIGIARWLQKKDKKVGYLKPVCLADAGNGGDADFVKLSLGLEEPLESLTPLSLTRQEIKTGSGLGDKVQRACNQVAAGKDIVLLEAAGGLSTDADLAQVSSQIAEAVDAKVVIIVAHARDLPWEKIASECGTFGQRLVGVVINRVPKNKVEAVTAEADTLLAKKGIKILGILPEERSLLGASVAEIAESLQVEALCCAEGLSGVVENVMIGAMTPDSGADYFGRKDNKAVIARGERPDMHLAALATSTKCLILTGGVGPSGQVLSWAEDKGVPILLTQKDTLATVTDVEQAFARARFRHQGNAENLDKILQQGFDFAALAEGVGLAG